MASVYSQIVSWVATTAAAIDGTGSYTFDLSADDAVKVADPINPGQVTSPPQVFIFDWDIEHEPGQPLSSWNHTFDVYLAGFVQTSDGSQSALKLAALDLAADLFYAFTQDRTAGGLVYDVRPTTDAVNGAGPFKGYGVASCRLRFIFRGDPRG